MHQPPYTPNPLTHIRTAYTGDETFTHTDYPDDRFTVWHDDDTFDPRKDWDDVTQIVYRANYRGTVEQAECQLSDCFTHAFESDGYYDDDHALKVTRRYARVILGWSEQRALYAIRIDTIRGYSQSDWWNVLTIDYGTHPRPDSYAVEFATYLRCDVYGVVQERFTPCDDPHCQADRLDGLHADDPSHWDSIESCGGIYSDDFAQGAVEEFITSYARDND